MTDTQQSEKTGQKSGQSIGFLRAAEKMQIATFDIPLTFLEDLGFSKDRIQAAKYMNRRFISGFYARVRGIGEKLSFGSSAKKAQQQTRQVGKTEAEKAVEAAKAAAVKATGVAEPTGKAARPEVQIKPKPKPKPKAKADSSPEIAKAEKKTPKN